MKDEREVGAVEENKSPRKGSGNLIPASQRSEDERREIGRKGGKASGEARRRKRSAKQMAKYILELEPVITADVRATLINLGVPEDERPNLMMLSLLSVAKKATRGDLKASQMLLEVSGQVDTRASVERERLKLDKERFKFEKELRGKLEDGTASNNDKQILAIADLLKNPVERRTIEDVENSEEDDEP